MKIVVVVVGSLIALVLLLPLILAPLKGDTPQTVETAATPTSAMTDTTPNETIATATEPALSNSLQPPPTPQQVGYPSKEGYDQVREGMNSEKVIAILGYPHLENGAEWHYQTQQADTIQINFSIVPPFDRVTSVKWNDQLRNTVRKEETIVWLDKYGNVVPFFDGYTPSKKEQAALTKQVNTRYLIHGV